MSNNNGLLQKAIEASLSQTEASKGLADEVRGKMGGIDQKVAEAERKAESISNSMADNLGFMAINRNHDLGSVLKLPNKQGVINDIPIGWGVKQEVLDCCHLEIIPVTSGSEVSERHIEAQALLDFMGTGATRKHWSGSFNILKIKVLDNSFTSQTIYDAHIADQHLRGDPATSFLRYVKVIGKTNVRWCGGDTAGEWVQLRSVIESTPGAGSYAHVDLVFDDKTEVGDVVMIALPMVVPGIWPAGRKHSKLYNLKDHFTKVIAGKHQ